MKTKQKTKNNQESSGFAHNHVNGEKKAVGDIQMIKIKYEAFCDQNIGRILFLNYKAVQECFLNESDTSFNCRKMNISQAPKDNEV